VVVGDPVIIARGRRVSNKRLATRMDRQKDRKNPRSFLLQCVPLASMERVTEKCPTGSDRLLWSGDDGA
jgi:hypothetical protein